MGAGGQGLALGHAVQKVVVWLAHYGAIDSSQVAKPTNLSHPPGPEIRDAKIPDFSLSEQVGKGVHRLVQRRRMVLFVKIENVNDIGSKPAQTGFDRIKGPAPRQPAIIGAIAGWVCQLGRQNPPGSFGRDSASHDFLRPAAVLDSSRIDNVNSNCAGGCDDPL